jgi:uncharacterized membrane protein YphA (DoxX/SURF4 family)
MASPSTQPHPEPYPAAWSLAHRLFFRFLAVYFLLYSLPNPGTFSIFTSVPFGATVFRWYVNVWRAICPWVGSHVFHLTGRAITYVPTGSGDTTLNYIENMLFVLVALAAALIWSVLDRKRKDYRQVEPWLRLLVRYTLAFTLLGYGFAKIFPLQFRPPNLQRLIEPYGDFSPMGALWRFMGASVPYIIFAGAAEATAGLLLLFRRTTTLGSLVAFGVLLNVMVLNYCYDVPVKLYSTNLVLMAVWLASGDFRRLLDVLVHNRVTAPADQSAPRFSRRWARVSALAFQILFVGYTLFGTVYGGWRGYQAAYIHPQRPPIYGLYQVQQFVLNGREIPPLITDGARWRTMIAEFPGFITVKMMNDSLRGYQARFDAAKSDLTLSEPNQKAKTYSLHYARPGADQLTLEGDIADGRVSIRLRKIDASKFLLMSRGFHWISEVPFNR